MSNTLQYLSSFSETKNKVHACAIAVLLQGAWCQQSFNWLLFSLLAEEVPKRWLAVKDFCWRAVRSYYKLCYHPVILTGPLFSHLSCEKRDRQALGEHRMKREEQETQHSMWQLLLSSEEDMNFSFAVCILRLKLKENKCWHKQIRKLINVLEELLPSRMAVTERTFGPLCLTSC